MKTRLARGLLLVLLGCITPGFSQIIYTETATSRGIDHSYGNGAPGGGVSFCDVDQDGWDDITLGGIAGQGIRFFRNEGGTFTLMPQLVDIPFEIKQILWVDYDNDGDKDLYIACFDGYNMLFQNTGQLALVDVTASAGLPMEIHRGFGALWADVNRDSRPDLYFVKRRTESDSAVNENRLFLNRPGGYFEEVTDEAGVADRGKKPFCAVAIDYDNDKWPDLYINNDKQTINTLLRNTGDGYFEDVSAASMANIQMDAMGTAMGDYDNDGWLDMYLSNIPTGNVMLHNNGPNDEGVFTFTDRAAESNTLFNSVAWGTNFLDADNDGDLDLYVSGMLSGEDQINSTLYENEGDGTFRNLEGELTGDTCVSFSNAVGDANLDGIADIMVINQGGFKSQLWMSHPPLIPNHFLKIKLEGVLSNRDGIGTRIEVFAGSSYQMRYTHCGISFLGQNSGTEIIGLGSVTQADSIVITWPTGHIDRMYAISADQTLYIREGSSTNGMIAVDPDITLVTRTTFPRPAGTSSLIVFPNPVSTHLFIAHEDPGTYLILHPDGRQIQTGYWSGNPGEGLDVSSFTSGLYLMVIFDGKHLRTGRWVKL